LIITELDSKPSCTITSLLTALSKFQEIPLSTLKLNARVLKDLNLISFGDCEKPGMARLTDFGEFVCDKISEASSETTGATGDSLTAKTAGRKPADPGSNPGPRTIDIGVE
jgi:hypothetical protein